MSTVFSRRSFLKYTAVAAVAVAGTSLLGGCSGAETAIRPLSSDNVVLKVKSTLETLEFNPTEYGHATFRSISSMAARIPSSVSPNRFAVKAYDKYQQLHRRHLCGFYPGHRHARLDSGDTNPISRGQECISTVKHPTLACDAGRRIPSAPVASLRIIYTPDTEYNEYTANWIISPDTAVPALG